jgi:hypothetical protein
VLLDRTSVCPCYRQERAGQLGWGEETGKGKEQADQRASAAIAKEKKRKKAQYFRRPG